MIDVVKFFQSKRGFGHTQLSIDGIKNYDKPFFVVGSTLNSARDIVNRSGNKNAIPVSLNSLHKASQGCNLPAIFDNYAMTSYIENIELSHTNYVEFLKDCHNEILKYEKECRNKDIKNLQASYNVISALRQEIIDLDPERVAKLERYNLEILSDNFILKGRINHLSKLSLWNRVFNYKKLFK